MRHYLLLLLFLTAVTAHNGTHYWIEVLANLTLNLVEDIYDEVDFLVENVTQYIPAINKTVYSAQNTVLAVETMIPNINVSIDNIRNITDFINIRLNNISKLIPEIQETNHNVQYLLNRIDIYLIICIIFFIILSIIWSVVGITLLYKKYWTKPEYERLH